MKRRRWVLATTIVGITVLQPVHAYLDPGTGSILLQGLIAAVAAVTVGGRMYWSKIKGLFRSQKPSPPPEWDKREESNNINPP